jgi:hypothetical protein
LFKIFTNRTDTKKSINDNRDDEEKLAERMRQLREIFMFDAMKSKLLHFDGIEYLNCFYDIELSHYVEESNLNLESLHLFLVFF